jgi:hypothetical protein
MELFFDKHCTQDLKNRGVSADANALLKMKFKKKKMKKLLTHHKFYQMAGV